ncbi:MAG: bifunctional UDP-N-acetylmuramoyl-tripeptide:D-alanyl-D-alanine ligase/alanine racemase [Bacteroidota bacterium]
MGPRWKLSYIGKVLNGKILGEEDTLITALAIDSRTVSSSEATLFIALRGERHDGHDYIRDLYERGIRAFLVSQQPAYEDFPEAGFCLVNDTLSGLQELAAAWRSRYRGEVVAITGSNGKTIVKEWIYQCMSTSLSVHRSPKSYNSQVGVPLSVWMIQEDHDLAVIEAGISRPGEMEKLQSIIKPELGIFTNLGGSHQENFPDLETKLSEKLKLFQGCERIICRADATVGGLSLLAYMEKLGGQIVDWSLSGKAKYAYRILNRSASQTDIQVSYLGKETAFHLPFGDDASIENALHVLTYTIESGRTVESAIACIECLEPVSMRLEMLQGIQGSMLINDSYNSDTGGLKAALDLVGQQDKKKDRVVILSDVLQSGREDQSLYAEIAGYLLQKEISLFIGIGPALMQQRALFNDNSLFFRDTDEFLKRMDRTLFVDRIILIKGSRLFGFERITAELQLKTHQTRLEIDLNAMVHNLNYYRSLLNEHVKTMVMVKALSYGSGNVEIANLLQFHKVDYLAVAFIDEGVELRRAGIHLPIMVLNPDPSGFGPMLDYQLEPEVYSMAVIKALNELIQYREIKNYPIHVKLDTGMHRLGFQETEIAQLIPILARPEFRVASVFSHLAGSGDPEHDDFSLEQIKKLRQNASVIKEALGINFDLHILNSAGIERFPHAQLDMVRLGIGLHGIGSVAQVKPVSAFKTTISQIRTVSAGESVGYSRKGRVEHISEIATIPLGYADGLDRRLGNGQGSVWINGSAAPTFGDICMDMTMIDVTGLGASEGEAVEVFGKHQEVSEIARRIGTIPYEILTAIPERVKRVYLQE